MKKILFAVSCSLITIMSYAQSDCNVSITTASDTVGCGETFELIAEGEAFDTLLTEGFNSSSLGAGWTSTGNVLFSNPCGPTLDGTPAAWFGSNPPPRELITVDYDLTCGGQVCFDLDFANDENNTDCEDPDENDEGVYFQYSIDNGATWVTIFYFDPTAFTMPNGYYSWDTYCFNLPAAAQTTSTRLRWYQDDPTNNNYDHWGIDNVQVLGSICGTYDYEWINSGVTDDTLTETINQDQQSYTVIYTDGSDTCSATIDIYGIIDANLPNDTSICGLIDYDIVSNPTLGSGSYDFQWNTGETTNTIENATTGQYVVEVTDQTYTTCVATDTMNFEMYPVPDVDFTSDPLCQGALTYFTDLTTIPPGYTLSNWSWDFDDQGATSTDQNPTHEFGGVGLYDVNLTVDSGDGCTNDTTITISIEPSPFAQFDFESICEGEEAFFENTSLGNYENSQWVFEPAPNDTVNSTDASFEFPSVGTYDVTLIIEQSNNSCSDTLVQTITVHPKPDIQLASDIQIGEPVLNVEFYNQSTGAINYYWDFANGNTSTSLDDTLNESFSEPGEYQVSLTGISSEGCESTNTLIITVEYEDLLIEVPNIFTPNNDNTNDEFYINYLQAKKTILDFEIVILNRWGNVVKTSNDPDFTWDGSNNGGKNVSDGTYFYKINISTVKGQNLEEHGFVQVVND